MGRAPHVRQTERLVLASASPRRRDILEQLGLSFVVIDSGVDEPPRTDEPPRDYAAHLAALKATEVATGIEREHAGAFVLGADTIVVIGEHVLGKPTDTEDAVAILMRLSGQTHEVITAVALRRAGGEQAWDMAVRTRVTFRAFDLATARRYAQSGEASDKAGSYAIQGLGAGLVRTIEGSYSNVVGLPAVETLELLQSASALERWP